MIYQHCLPIQTGSSCRLPPSLSPCSEYFLEVNIKQKNPQKTADAGNKTGCFDFKQLQHRNFYVQFKTISDIFNFSGFICWITGQVVTLGKNRNVSPTLLSHFAILWYLTKSEGFFFQNKIHNHC